MKASEAALIAVGRVLAPQGNRGEVRVEALTDNPARLTKAGRMILSRHEGPEAATDDSPCDLVSGRVHGKFFALKFAGVDSITAAEALRDRWLKVRRSEIGPLPEGSYYLFEIVGMEVVREDGTSLGVIDEILRGAGNANDVYVVRGRIGETLIPAVREVVVAVDVPSRRMVVRLAPPFEAEGDRP